MTVPGLATVTYGQVSGAATGTFAAATVNGLRIDLDATNSTVWIGRAQSRIDVAPSPGSCTEPLGAAP